MNITAPAHRQRYHNATRAVTSSIRKCRPSLACIAIVTSISATCGASATQPASSLCERLSQILSSPSVFQQRSPIYFLERPCGVSAAPSSDSPNEKAKEGQCVELSSGPSIIPNVDLDGDGLLDALHFKCPGGSGLRAADPCTAEVRFAGGQRLQLPGYFPLVLHNGAYYAVDKTKEASVSGSRSGSAYRITRTGLKLVCTNNL